MRVLRRASADPATVNAMGGQRLEVVRLRSESISRLLGRQRDRQGDRPEPARLGSLEVESVGGSKYMPFCGRPTHQAVQKRYSCIHGACISSKPVSSAYAVRHACCDSVPATVDLASEPAAHSHG